jgi:hypothetical protein
MVKENENKVVHKFKVKIEDVIKPSKYKKVVKKRLDKYKGNENDVIQYKGEDNG